MSLVSSKQRVPPLQGHYPFSRTNTDLGRTWGSSAHQFAGSSLRLRVRGVIANESQLRLAILGEPHVMHPLEIAPPEIFPQMGYSQFAIPG